MRNRLINITLFLVTSVLCLFLAEVITRHLYPEYDTRGRVTFKEYEKDLILVPPNFSGTQWRTFGEFNVKIDINKYGFRDTKDLKDATPKDIFVMGDSFSFGHGVEEGERFSNVLQDYFEEQTKVYNIGISGSHLINYQRRLEYAKEKGAKINKLIVGLCIENDLLDYEEILKDSEKDMVQPENSWRQWLKNRSCLYNFLAIRLRSNEKVRKTLVRMGIVKEMYWRNEQVSDGKEIESTIRQIEQLIEGHESLVVLIPFRLMWVENRGEVEAENHKKLKMSLVERGINILDLKPIFEATAENPLEEFHFEKDGHWNKNGHRVAAKAIYEVLEKQKSSIVSETMED